MTCERRRQAEGRAFARKTQNKRGHSLHRVCNLGVRGARCEGGLCAVQALHARLLPEAGRSVGAGAACGARSRPDGASRQLAVCECATG